MGLIPTITCRRCKREYSALRGRCPHCGTRKTKQSERTPTTTAGTRPGTTANSRVNSNAKWQMIFGLVLVAAVIIAVIAIIMISTGGEKPAKTTPPPETTVTPPPTTATPIPTPTPTPTPTVTSITITYYGAEKTDFSAPVGDETQLSAIVYPMDIAATVTWSSTDEGILTVSSDGVVVGVSKGKASVIAECGGVKQECIVYIT